MIDLVDRVLYSVNRDLDSWDIENLRYIRKISIRDSTSETLSYVSDDDHVLTSPSPPPPQPNYDHYHPRPHPPPSTVRILEEAELPSRNDNKSRPPEYSCYLMDVILVANESVISSPSVSSADSFSSAIRKGFFDMDNNDDEASKPPPQRPHDNELPQVGRRKVKKSVSFMDESIPRYEIEINSKQTKDKRIRTTRSVSFTGTTKSAIIANQDLPALLDYDHGRREFSSKTTTRDLFVPAWSRTLQSGYANNWASLETYVRRLQHRSNSL